MFTSMCTNMFTKRDKELWRNHNSETSPTTTLDVRSVRIMAAERQRPSPRFVLMRVIILVNIFVSMFVIDGHKKYINI